MTPPHGNSWLESPRHTRTGAGSFGDSWFESPRWGGGGGGPAAFISTWETTAPSESITLPHFGTGYNFTINWGDGTEETLTDADAPFSHAYATPGVHTITIAGGSTFPRWRFANGGDKLKIKTIEQFGDIGVVSGFGAFHGCRNLKLNATDPVWATDDWANGFHSTGIVEAYANMFSLNTFCLSFYRVFYDANELEIIRGTAFKNCFASLSWREFARTCALLATVEAGLLVDAAAMADIRGGLQGPNILTALPSAGDWAWAGVTQGDDFLNGVTINTPDYNAMMIGIEAQAVQNNVNFHGGSSVATGSGLTARNNLITDHSWTITDAS